MKNPSKLRSSAVFLFCLVWLLAASAQAALVAHFQFEEGAIDPTTNTTYSAVGSESGTLTPDPSGFGELTWVTTGLPPVPSPGTTAALHFVSPANGVGSTPYVATTIYTGDASSNNLAGTGPKTITAWIKPQFFGTNDVNPTIVVLGQSTPNGARMTLRGIMSGSIWRIRAEFQGGGRTGTKDLNDGNWHHVAVVLSTNSSGTCAVSNAVLYVDGAVEALTASTGPAQSVNIYTNRQITIGSSAGAGFFDGRQYTGYMDDVRIYDEALTSSDILNLYLGPGAAPSVTALVDQQFVLGSTNATVTFTAGAVGTPPLTYTWKKDGTIIPGQTSDTLAFSPASLSDLGTYTVAVTNGYGGTSKPATLTLNTAPIVPPRQAVLQGASATFSVTMPADSSGYTYQWRTNAVDIVGATAATLTIPSAAATDASTEYQVVATLSGNSATSTPPASLAVLAAPSSAYAQAVLNNGPAGYWRLGEANGAPLAVSETTYYSGGYSNYAGAELGAAGALTGDPNTCSTFASGNYVQVPYDAELTRSNGLTLEVWVNPDFTGSRQSLISCYGGTPSWGYELYLNTAGQPVFRTYLSTSTTFVISHDLSGLQPLTAGTWTHLVATFDGANKRLYVNGYPEAGRTVGYIPALNIPVRFGAGPGGLDPVSGGLDEVAIYSKVLNWSDVAAHYRVGSGVIPPSTPPSLTIEPSGTDVILTWEHNWLLQSKAVMDDSPAGWTGLGGLSPSTISVTNDQTYFRLVLP